MSFQTVSQSSSFSLAFSSRMAVLQGLLAAALVWSALAHSPALRPPQFVMNLSEAPEHRWDGAVAAVLARHPWEHSFGPVFEHYNQSVFSGYPDLEGTAQICETAVQTHYPEIAGELRGIAAQLSEHSGTHVSLGYMAIWLYFHELSHGVSDFQTECTGIVVQTESGEVLQGGNMDQSPMAARNLTLQVRFVDGAGNTVFQGVDWYALLTAGVTRAVMKGVASVQENWRAVENHRSFEDVCADVAAGALPQTLVFRRYFERAHAGTAEASFAAFAEHVENVHLAAPFYVIAAGPGRGDGVVIARSEDGSDGTARLGDPDKLAAPGDYFLAQDNTDRWQPEDDKDPRRTAAELLLRNLGRDEGASMLGLMVVTSSFPVHNPHSAFSAIMSAATGELHAYVREAVCPVDIDASVVPEYRYCRDQPKSTAILI